MNLAIQLVEPNGSGLTVAGGWVFIAAFTFTVGPLLGIARYFYDRYR